MIKIPAFIIGGLLILTGIVGYLFQEPGLSIKITGPLAEDAQLTLSDGNQSHELDLGFASSNAAGEHAYWLIYNLNLNHAKDASQGNYAIDQGATNRGYTKKSFWYASSKGETMKALIQESENFQGAGGGDPIEIDWANVDQNSSKIRFIFKNHVNSPGPITLQANNWQNIDISPKLKPNEKIVFSTSPTAFIPGILGIILILLTMGAAKMPSAHKHFMHAAVLVALICFFVVSKMLVAAYSEMNWLKQDPFMIIHVSSLKPTVMLLSSGLLLIFVILCVVSFIEARKNRIAEEEKTSKLNSSKKANSEKESPKSDTQKEESSTENDTKNEKKESTRDSKDSSTISETKNSADKKGETEKKQDLGKNDTTKDKVSPSSEKSSDSKKPDAENKDSEVNSNEGSIKKAQSSSPSATSNGDKNFEKKEPSSSTNNEGESKENADDSKKFDKTEK